MSQRETRGPTAVSPSVRGGGRGRGRKEREREREMEEKRLRSQPPGRVWSLREAQLQPGALPVWQRVFTPALGSPGQGTGLGRV